MSQRPGGLKKTALTWSGPATLHSTPVAPWVSGGRVVSLTALTGAAAAAAGLVVHRATPADDLVELLVVACLCVLRRLHRRLRLYRLHVLRRLRLHRLHVLRRLRLHRLHEYVPVCRLLTAVLHLRRRVRVVLVGVENVRRRVRELFF